MKPVFQTRFGPDGDCYAACLASILEIAIDQVPVLGEQWTHDLRRWLESMGMQPMFFYGGNPKYGYTIVGQHMPDRTIHSSVWFDQALIHDPSPRPLSRPSYPILLRTTLRPT